MSLIEACRPLRILTLIALTCGNAALLPGRVFAVPFVPTSDSEILERLPWSPNDAAARVARARREELARDPQNLALALDAARADIVRGRAAGDPRYFGYAEAALGPWWDMPEPPPSVQVLRATIRQNLHDFDAALVDLREVLARDPRNAQAWLTRALIEQTRGDYPDARRSCVRLLAVGRASTALRLAALTCTSSVTSFGGGARQAYATLTEALRATDVPADERVWPLGVLADIATRLGDVEPAAAHYEEALALAPEDGVLRTAYADLLLDRGEPAAALALLGPDTANDGFLLRVALAENALGAPSRAAHVEELSARFAAAKLRGDGRHLREEARFTLVLLHDPAAALALAERDWAVQREPEDARVLLAAALAAGDAAAAERVRTWIAERGLEDVRLAALNGTPEGSRAPVAGANPAGARDSDRRGGA